MLRAWPAVGHPGVAAFGRGKKVVCVEGRDTREALDRNILIDALISIKARHAAVTGQPFIPVRELFPMRA